MLRGLYIECCFQILSWYRNRCGFADILHGFFVFAPQPFDAELAPAPEGLTFLPAKNDKASQELLGLTLVRAIIAAARSDGRLEAQESQAIFQRIESLGLDSESQALLVAEMGRPVDMDEIVASATSFLRL